MTRPDKNNSTGIYIHIPFCASKCPYCDFYSLNNTSLSESYVKALINDIKTFKGIEEFTGKKEEKPKASTVYFGGGTPSLLGEEKISEILCAVKESFLLSENAEITLECNPSTPDTEKLFSGVKKAGVNRISLGMQSAVNEERKLLGRKADSERVKFCVEKARETGFDNISLDVMLGIPKQTKDSLKYTLDFALSLGVPHISAYILKLEEGTFFYKNQNRLNLPDEDLTADMYIYMCDYLEKAGMRHYEISNFCKDGKLSRHNMNYWYCGEYLGFGAAAHSYFNGKRFYYERSIVDYIDGKKAVFDTYGGDFEEIFMLGLRTDTGVDTKELFREFNINPGGNYIKELSLFASHSLINDENGILKLTDKGMLLSNSIISSLLSKLL